MSKVHVKTGDKVVVINGKDRGKQGKVLQVSPSEGKVIVEGINIVSKHVKPRKMGEPGGIIKAESALYADKVQLICPKCGRPTRVGHMIDDKGKKVRVCKKADCGAKFE
ncbi:MAG: 50S ribosomal protein L24 [Clostridiales bacterium]|nr:50S ribosomal protein L24 [Clostridiales bacterium]MCD7827828.1 50S ribosomal protein L24 [Clostridiales bacterium]